MSLFKGNYLKVSVPVTVDGINLAYKNGQPMVKEVHLPTTALRPLMSKNKRLPNQLKMKIEEVDNNIPQRPLPPSEDTITIPKAQLEQLLARIKSGEGKPGANPAPAGPEKKKILQVPEPKELV